MRAGVQTISKAMMMSKGIILLEQTGVFNDNTREWRRQSSNLKTWAKYKLFFSPSTPRAEKSGDNCRKRGVNRDGAKNIQCNPPTPPEEHHGKIEDTQTIMQGMQEQSYDMEGLVQANAVLTR